jgi:hypothetical protein
MDPDLGRHREVWAAAGVDRAVFPVSPAALRALTNATVAPIAAAEDAVAATSAGSGAASSANSTPPPTASPAPVPVDPEA